MNPVNTTWNPNDICQLGDFCIYIYVCFVLCIFAHLQVWQQRPLRIQLRNLKLFRKVEIKNLSGHILNYLQMNMLNSE